MGEEGKKKCRKETLGIRMSRTAEVLECKQAYYLSMLTDALHGDEAVAARRGPARGAAVEAAHPPE